ncbi:MAG: Fe-S cluster assembly protein SufD [Oligoflexales bacterium]|nr:Fe-S cluster assembly protein SufD [Oligoflexales bacterium]
MSTSVQPFEDIFQDSGCDAPKWVLQEKERAWKEFCRAGVPTRKVEDWKYTNLSFLNKTHYQKAAAASSLIPDALKDFLIPETITIVYWDGIFMGALSQLNDLPKGLQIAPLATAFANQEQEPSSLYQRFADLSKDNALIHMNEALASNGIFINVEKNAQINKPVHILHLNSHTAGWPIASFPRITIILEDSANAKIYESFHCMNKSTASDVRAFCNKTTDVLLKKNSKLTYICTQKLSQSSDQICHTRVLQEKHSLLDSHVLGVGGKLSRQSIEVWQEGEEAHSSLNGLFLGREKQQCEQRTSIRHKVPYGTSDQYYKGLLTGEARGVFLGHVGVEKGAQKVRAKQLNKNLLLNDRVEIDTKPELEIDSDDVKCAHGATVSQLRSEEIFYLQSRGINKEKAKFLLSHAFAYEIIAKLGDDTVAAIWNEIVRDFFKEAQALGDFA